MPRQQPPSNDLFARAAELRAIGATWDTIIGPTVAATGIGCSDTGTRADLLACDDVADVRAPHSHVDRCRVAESFENNLMNLLEPDGRMWGRFTPWHADDRNAPQKKNPAFALFRRPIGPDFEPIWAAKYQRKRLKERKNEVGSMSFARGYRLVPVGPFGPRTAARTTTTITAREENRASFIMASPRKGTSLLSCFS